MTEDKYSLHNNNNIIKAKTDKEYLGELIVHNEDLIWFSIRNYVGNPVKLAKCNSMEKEDIFQIACIGFINAVNNFDCDKGFMFTTYAPFVISGEVKGYLRDKGKLIKLPRSAHDLKMKIADYTEEIYYDKYIPIEKVAEGLNKNSEEIKKVLSVGDTPYLVSYCKKDPYKDTNLECLQNTSEYDNVDKCIDVENDAVEEVYLDQLLETVRSKLNERDKRILSSKLEGKTHEQIATEEDIAKITVTRTMNKIRKLIKEIEE